ncbi:hypothetical protein [Levilactobacillus sp. N40-8-2]|uniref:hypothetical protein n=1 Tax=Levilactobacillus muriae TaxID=3238987 RepID=UPI0038B28A7C
MTKTIGTKILLAFLGPSLLIPVIYLNHEHVQKRFADFSIIKRSIAKPTEITVNASTIKILHYRQLKIKGDLWSYLTIDSPKVQKLDSNSFKLYRGPQEEPNIYFNEDIRVNSKNSRILKKGPNKILMHTDGSSKNAETQLVIQDQNNLHFTQNWLTAKF